MGGLRRDDDGGGRAVGGADPRPRRAGVDTSCNLSRTRSKLGG
jgi:hypothetical protein